MSSITASRFQNQEKTKKMPISDSEQRRRMCEIELPALVLVNIFCRLPFMSIVNCRRVCKTWYQLVSDPYFEKTYRSNTQFLSILHSRSDGVSWTEIDSDNDITNNSVYTRQPLQLPKDGGVFKGWIKGCCNGLVCLLHERLELYVCNPVLKEYLMIPQPNLEMLSKLAYGFGYCSDTDQYKIIRISTKKCNLQSLNSGEAAIYTIGVDKFWRDVGEVPFPNDWKICCVPLNGNLHWIDDESGGRVRLSSINIKGEKVKSVPAPCHLNVAYGHLFEVGVLRNRLCLFYGSCPNEFDIWWMKEYGVGESWTRERISDNMAFTGLPHLLTIWRDGEILIWTTFGNMLSFHPKDKKYTKVCSFTAKHHWHGETVVYTPSFCSIKSMLKKTHS